LTNTRANSLHADSASSLVLHRTLDALRDFFSIGSLFANQRPQAAAAMMRGKTCNDHSVR
jgi:hypothetical protein